MTFFLCFSHKRPKLFPEVCPLTGLTQTHQIKKNNLFSRLDAHLSFLTHVASCPRCCCMAERCTSHHATTHFSKHVLHYTHCYFFTVTNHFIYQIGRNKFSLINYAQSKQSNPLSCQRQQTWIVIFAVEGKHRLSPHHAHETHIFPSERKD